MTDSPDHQPASPRARLREITDELFDPEAIDSLRVPDLVDKVTALIDAEQITRWPLLRQVVDAFVREVVNQRVARTRGLLLMGDEVVTRTEFEKRLRQRAGRFERWLEHAGDRHIQLLAMKKRDLLVAADERQRQGMAHLHIGALWQRLADGMTEDQQVGDRYTTEDIAVLADKLHITVIVEDADGPTIVADPPPPTDPPAPLPAPPAPLPPAQRSRAGNPSTGVRVSVPQAPRPRTTTPRRP